MSTKSVILIILFFMLTACASHDYNEIDTTNLSQLENARLAPHTPLSSASDFSQLRSKALVDTAMSVAAQGGLASASKEINAHLEKNKKYLDSVFNFDALVLSHGVMPPVLEEANNTLNLDDPNTIRVSDKTYRIIQQARFATTPPNWREYLWLSFSKPESPNRSLLPRNSEEQKAWRKGIRMGWEKGIEQAYSIFEQNLARLKRDYRGMLLYRKLLQEKMISAPFVSRAELGITGDGTDMRINDQVLRIVELPQLQTNSERWKAIVVKHDD